MAIHSTIALAASVLWAACGWMRASAADNPGPWKTRENKARTIDISTPGRQDESPPPKPTANPDAPQDLDFTGLIPQSIPANVAFRQTGWHLWDPCVIKGDDRKFYLYYSRWPTRLGYDAWCTHAEIAWATATNASGPYEFQGVALPARGKPFWDGHSAFNACVVRVGTKYYLYYTGNHGTPAWSADRAIPPSSQEWWAQRNNQRIGVAVADSPAGPWQRMDKPLLDVGPGFGQTIINVPNLVIKPDGGCRLYYKTLGEGPGRFGSGVFHYGADAPGPLGPFVRHPEPMVNKNKLMPQVKSASTSTSTTTSSGARTAAIMPLSKTMTPRSSPVMGAASCSSNLRTEGHGNRPNTRW